ncbi:unnamed protein product [Blepharisma stoltei]|uniref:Uncharacterized protein n=1 Tax=Blepharisma stoltei TaxID=1481888 RepID=A0AAU9J294_9CILI|nr:unnamed protein product [Blepharisma stoltei]
MFIFCKILLNILDLSVKSRARNSVDTFLTSPISTPTTPTIYEHRAKSSNFLKRRSVSSWSKRKEAIPLKINFVLEEEKIPLTPW